MTRFRKAAGITSPTDDAIGSIASHPDAKRRVASPLRLNFGFFLAVDANA